MDPHEAYHPPSPYAEKYAHNLYDGEIAYTDKWVGILMDFLKKQNLEENTLIVLTGDHGESLGDHDESTHGIFIYDATLHVPLIINYPAMFSPARVPSLVRLIDIAPTILAILGEPIPDEMDGQVAQGLFSEELHVLSTIDEGGVPSSPNDAGDGYSDEEADEVAARLRGLGYID